MTQPLSTKRGETTESRLRLATGGRRRANLKEEIAREIRSLILTGSLRPGAKIDQDEIAQTFGVSRLPVREALISLASEGLVENMPGRGAFVAEISADDVRDQFAVYGAVAGLACGHAAANRTDKDLAQLESLAQRLSAARDRPMEYERLSFEFHRAIAHAAKSTRIVSILRLLFRFMPTHFFRIGEAWVNLAEEFHLQMVDAIRAKDGAQAEALMRKYMSTWSARVSEALRRNEGDQKPPELRDSVA
ncbi:MAG: GntR family transcriptional regulator [Hyphomicrobiaceae bacterium]